MDMKIVLESIDPIDPPYDELEVKLTYFKLEGQLVRGKLKFDNLNVLNYENEGHLYSVMYATDVSVDLGDSETNLGDIINKSIIVESDLEVIMNGSRVFAEISEIEFMNNGNKYEARVDFFEYYSLSLYEDKRSVEESLPKYDVHIPGSDSCDLVMTLTEEEYELLKRVSRLSKARSAVIHWIPSLYVKKK